jgi:UDP-glucose:(heptosyl)LPS alpha-1,3-glucosyltransferase
MRIAFLYRRLAREGGTEGDLYRTAAGLAERRHDVHLFCGDFRTPVPPGVTAHRVRVLRAGRLARLLSFAWLAPRAASRAGPWDVVVGFGRTGRQDLVRCGGGTHRAYLETMRESGARRRGIGPYHRAVLTLEARQFRAGTFRRVLAVSSRVRDEIVSGYAVEPERVHVIYNGVDLERFDPGRRATLGPSARRRLGLPEGSRVVLSVGSGFRRKGIDTLLRVWADGPPADAWLVVVGGDERLGAYRRMAMEPRLAGRVLLTGPQAAVEEFYAAADGVVVASLQEAFGNVVLEGLATGLPVITSERVGAAELLTGPLRELVIADPRDVTALRERLCFALGAAWGDLSRAARRIAEGRPWSSHFVELEALLEQTAGSDRHE